MSFTGIMDTIRGRESRPQGEQVLVFARHKKQFNRFVGLSKHNTRDYRFVESSRDLRGMNISDYRVATLRDYTKHPRFYEINSTFKARTNKSIEDYVYNQRVVQMEAKWAKEDENTRIPYFESGLLRPREGDARITLPEGRYHISDSMRGMHYDSVVIDDPGFTDSHNAMLRAVRPEHQPRSVQISTPRSQETDIVTLPNGERIQGSQYIVHGERYDMATPSGYITQVSIQEYHELSIMDQERREHIRNIEENQRLMSGERWIVPAGTDIGSF